MSNTPRPPGPGTPLRAPPPSRGTRAPRLPTPRTDLDRAKPDKQGTPTTRSTAYSPGFDFVGKLGPAHCRGRLFARDSRQRGFGFSAILLPLKDETRKAAPEREGSSSCSIRPRPHSACWCSPWPLTPSFSSATTRKGRPCPPPPPCRPRAYTTRNEGRRGDHPRYRGTSPANPRGISCGPGLSLRPSDETLSAFPSPYSPCVVDGVVLRSSQRVPWWRRIFGG